MTINVKNFSVTPNFIILLPNGNMSQTLPSGEGNILEQDSNALEQYFL